MRVIVTRPAAQAAEWVQELGSNGVDAVALPLIRIAALADASAIRTAWQALPQQRLVIFVSPNAAAHFFASRPPSMAWPPAVLAGSPGPGTTRALVQLGVARTQVIEPAADAAQFDSESLWLQLADRDWQGASVLIVRGDSGRDWLAQTLRDRGAQVAHLCSYRRAPPTLDAREQALLQAAIEQPAAHLWFFSSSEAIDNLATATPQIGARVSWSRARAIATHPRIAARARDVGFGQVIEVRPQLAAVLACIQSLRP